MGRRPWLVLGWSWVAASVVVLLVFGVLRLRSLGGVADPTDDFGVRYLASPRLAWLHIAPGLVFLLLAPLQFTPALRRRVPALHRGLGRALMGLAAVSAVTALAAAWWLPAYGGAGTVAATAAFGAAFLLFLGRALWHARRREFAAHRECMIRVFALGLGVATIRLVILLCELITGAAMREVFAAAFWIGLAANALAAELWIRRTRPRSSASG